MIGYKPQLVRSENGFVNSLMVPEGNAADASIKDGFAFGELGRRGIKAVRDELLEKGLAYNCCRTILIRKRRQDALERAARNAADITTKTTLTALRCQKLASDWTHRAPAARRRHDNRRASAIHS